MLFYLHKLMYKERHPIRVLPEARLFYHLDWINLTLKSQLLIGMKWNLCFFFLRFQVRSAPSPCSFKISFVVTNCTLVFSQSCLKALITPTPRACLMYTDRMQKNLYRLERRENSSRRIIKRMNHLGEIHVSDRFKADVPISAGLSVTSVKPYWHFANFIFSQPYQNNFWNGEQS